jgi:Tfp pilus assembly protein PilZ
MSHPDIAAAAANARLLLASSLATLQQDPGVPPAVMDLAGRLAQAMGPLFKVERGQGESILLLEARAVLQAALSAMQDIDQSYPGVSNATAAIAQSLGILFAVIKAHRIGEAPEEVPIPAVVKPAAPVPVAAPPPPAPPPPAPPPPAPPPPAPPPPAPPPPAPVAYVPPAAPIASVVVAPDATPAMPLVRPAQQPILLVQHAPPPAAPVYAPPPSAASHAAHAGPPKRVTEFPESAAKVPVGPNGVPRLEAELSPHSDTNFYTNFLGDIRDHGGIFVSTYSTLAVGTVCEVAITFPGQLAAEVRGVVRWRREVGLSAEPGIGVEITHANPDAWGLIDRFVSKREPIVYDV